MNQMTMPPLEDVRRRTWGEATLVHLRVRIKHLFLTWFYLKPLLAKHLSKTYERPFATHPTPNIGYLNYFIIKFQWMVSAFFSQNRFLQIPYGLLGLMHLNHLVFAATERAALSRARKRGVPNPKGLPIPEFDWRNKSPEEFVEQFVRRPFPVVLRGFSNGTAAESVFTFEKLLELYGEEQVLLTTREKDGFEGKLSQVRDPKVYCHNSEYLFIRHPELKTLLGFDRLNPFSDGKREAYSQLFIGRKGTGTPLHCAAIWNWFHMLDGTKRWYFIDPNYSLYLYPVHVQGAMAATAHVSYPDRYDKEVYPLFEYCPYYYVDLEPGDVLLNPPWWWHAIDNTSEESVAVASRWHYDGVVGKQGMWTEEDYDIHRMFSMLHQTGFNSFKQMQEIFVHPSPQVDEHTTLRERKNRFVDKHYKLSTGKILGIRHKI